MIDIIYWYIRIYDIIKDMAKRTVGDTRTHKLIKVGGKSYTLTLPIEFVRHLRWQEGQKINVTLDGKKLIIEDWEIKKRT